MRCPLYEATCKADAPDNKERKCLVPDRKPRRDEWQSKRGQEAAEDLKDEHSHERHSNEETCTDGAKEVRAGDAGAAGWTSKRLVKPEKQDGPE